jgi:enoyl-CoA hydratase
MSEPHLLTERVDNILIATLNRPHKLNAMSAEMLSLLDAAIAAFRDDPSLRVLLIRAVGRYFCAGADVVSSELMDTSSGSLIRDAHRRKIGGVQRMWDELEAIEKPIVAAHHGPCVGGGLEMSLSCDFRLAAANASYSFPESLFGSLPASGGVSRLTRIVGTHWARYFLMANMPVDASRALAMGLVHEVFPNESFAENVMAFCRHLAKQKPEVMGTAKIAIELARDLQAAQARSLERLANSTLLLGDEYKSGIAEVRSRLQRGKT